MWHDLLPHSIQALVLPNELNEFLNPEAELQAALRAKTRGELRQRCVSVAPGTWV
jgi:hypothetical protein